MQMTQQNDPAQSARKDWLSVLAKAPAPRLAQLVPDLPPHDILRPAEVGTAMVRGRIGGAGDAFNLGEMTVTRCSVRLPCGTVGHGYVQGRDRDHARRVAVVDALLQAPAGDALQSGVIAPLRAEMAARQMERAEKAAATRVEFFTMVRGEDQ